MTINEIKTKLAEYEQKLEDIKDEAMADGYISWLEQANINVWEMMVSKIKSQIEQIERKGSGLISIDQTSESLTSSVGISGANKHADVLLVQKYLNKAIGGWCMWHAYNSCYQKISTTTIWLGRWVY